VLWPMATTAYLRRTGGVPAAGWRRANSWWSNIYWESTPVSHRCSFRVPKLGVAEAVAATAALGPSRSTSRACGVSLLTVYSEWGGSGLIGAAESGGG
jgi:hypothetical protein